MRMPIARTSVVRVEPGQREAVRNTATMSAPIRVPSTVPRPPNRLGPADDDGRDGVEVERRFGLGLAASDPADEDPGGDADDQPETT